jgi:DNA repair protein RecN (Recombination protein N)
LDQRQRGDVAQLRDAADHMVDIHGQPASHEPDPPPAVRRALLDSYAAGTQTRRYAADWAEWKQRGQKGAGGRRE